MVMGQGGSGTLSSVQRTIRGSLLGPGIPFTVKSLVNPKLTSIVEIYSSLNHRRMVKEGVEHIHFRVLLSGKKNNDILNFACKWMEIEKALLSEVSQTQKEEYGMYSLISGF